MFSELSPPSVSHYSTCSWHCDTAGGDNSPEHGLCFEMVVLVTNSSFKLAVSILCMGQIYVTFVVLSNATLDSQAKLYFLSVRPFVSPFPVLGLS